MYVCVCSTEVLRDVTFTVEAGQTVALVCFPLCTTATFPLSIKYLVVSTVVMLIVLCYLLNPEIHTVNIQ